MKCLLARVMVASLLCNCFIFAVALNVSGAASAETVGFRNPITVSSKDVSCGNVLLAVQFADAITTRSVLVHGGYERDPLAKPFVSSNFGAIASVLAMNGIARFVTRTRPSLMCDAAIIESAAVVNNIRVIERLTR